LEAFKAILESNDYKVVTESDPGRLLEQIYQAEPDLIILDVLLSGADGRIICKNLKADKETRDIPIIIVSAHPSASKSIKQAGADDFLEKPFEMETLLNKIAKITNSEPSP
jgi:DNA-binding response OmpR family regulator